GRDPTSTFPDQPVFLDYLAGQGIDGGKMMVPGAVMEVADGRCEVRLPGGDGEALRPFTDKQRYLEEYAARVRPRIEAEKRTWPVPGIDLLAELKNWFEPLLELADHIKAGVGGPVLLRIRGGGVGLGGNGAGPEPAGADEEGIVIDFPAGEVRAHSGESCRYEFTFERPLIERL